MFLQGLNRSSIKDLEAAVSKIQSQVQFFLLINQTRKTWPGNIDYKSITLETLAEAIEEVNVELRAENKASNEKLKMLFEICEGIKSCVLETHSRYGNFLSICIPIKTFVLYYFSDGVAKTRLDEGDSQAVFEPIPLKSQKALLAINDVVAAKDKHFTILRLIHLNILFA